MVVPVGISSPLVLFHLKKREIKKRIKNKTMQKQTTGFTSISQNLRRSTKFNSDQKLFISYILGWQHNEMICFESNYSIAEEIGTALQTVKKIITNLKSFNWFNSIIVDNNQHQIIINEDLLEEYLSIEELPTKCKKNFYPVSNKNSK